MTITKILNRMIAVVAVTIVKGVTNLAHGFWKLRRFSKL